MIQRQRQRQRETEIERDRDLADIYIVETYLLSEKKKRKKESA